MYFFLLSDAEVSMAVSFLSIFSALNYFTDTMGVTE
jgi:hypothetical protein